MTLVCGRPLIAQGYSIIDYPKKFYSFGGTKHAKSSLKNVSQLYGKLNQLRFKEHVKGSV